jgi:hypothetical protein
LDAVNEEPEVTEALKTSVKQQEGKYNWFAQLRGSGTLTKSLDRAWKVWDAVRETHSSLDNRNDTDRWQVYAATQVPGTEVKEAKLFNEVNEWLTPRR